MKNAMELQVRKAALALTLLFAVQLLWAGARLVLQSEPDPIAVTVTLSRRK